DRRPHRDAGRARRGGDGSDPRGRRPAPIRAGDAARGDPRPPRSGNAGAPGLRAGRPPRARERARAAPAHRRAATAVRGARAAFHRGQLPRGRGLLRQAEERFPLSGLRRVAVEVPAAEAEIARAAFVDLFPAGFEERDRDGGVELAGYADDAGAATVRGVFPGAVESEVASGWEERWREFHRPVRVGPLWIGPGWEVPPPDALAVVIEPARAFGTGGHPTTRLCLELLVGLRSRLGAASVLDVGCGSGVLAVAAWRPGYRPVW